MATINIGDKQYPINDLDVIRVVAYSILGFNDLDLEPTDRGFTLVASHTGYDPVTVHGKTVAEVCDKFVAKVLTPSK